MPTICTEWDSSGCNDAPVLHSTQTLCSSSAKKVSSSDTAYRISDVEIYLIFVQFAIFVSRLSLVLEGDDDETNEDVDHEERNNNDVNEVKDCNQRSEVVDWSVVLGVGVD